MDHLTSQIVGVSFKLFSETEAKKLSVLPITSVQTFDPLGHPLDNSLVDTALGPLKRNDFCKTCGLTDSECLGHFGHIQLPLPVFNPFLMKQVYQVLKMFCFNCHHLLFTPFNVEIYIAQLRSLDFGLDYILDDIVQYADDISQSAKSIDWSTYEGRMFLRSKLNALINSEFSKKLQPSKQFDKATLLKNDYDDQIASLELVKIVNSKNVVEKKQHLFKDLCGLKIMKPTKICIHCNSRKRGLNVINKSLIIMTVGAKSAKEALIKRIDEENEDENKNKPISIEMKGKSYLTPMQAREHLRKLWANEKDVLLRLFPFLDIDFDYQKSDDECPMDVFFWETIIVSPNRFRPLRHMNGRSFEHHQTSALSDLMLVAKSLEYALENAKKTNSSEMIARFHNHWQRLQILCNRIYDTGMDNLPDKKSIGVKQILEKKEGLMRKNMMGKRVNFAARSVISPDPYIMADEIGMPMIFATKLSYPQPVTNWNVKRLQEMIINGPNQHPGALSITYEDGYTVRLKPDDLAQRRSIAATLHPPSFNNHQGLNGVKIVNRHLISGDVLLINRQPTLHKPSIMAHRARVLPKEKTLRLHYANCKCYNADFDGDEMNAHFPQSELARAEAYNIASVNYQFLVPKDGSPLSGLIQDHIVAGVLLSTRGRFFNKSDYQELIYGALSFMTNKPIKYLPPTILKPKCLWSGKQIISTLLLNLIPSDKPLPSFEIESKVSPKLLTVKKPRPWTSGGQLENKEMCESQVIFRHGELLCGIMDKANFGANKNGLIHVCYELYGGDIHSKLLTAIARLCTNFLQSYHGFTLGIKDILVKPKPDAKRKKLIKHSKTLGLDAIREIFNIPVDNDELILIKLREAHTSWENDFMMKQLDASYKSQTDSLNNQITQFCMPKGLVKTFPSNNLQMMIQTGAKGGSVNAIQISCLLGQIELEGRRIPLMMSGRTLPSFRPYETEPRAGGFVTGRFLSGIRPQEFFFHCMAGREGLIDTAVKTSRSGYLQRCLIKHLEGLVVNYDLTVRDSEGSVIQWLYGEDGLDILKSQSLKKAFFPTLFNNREALKSRKDEIEKLTLIRNPTLSKQIQQTRKFIKSLADIDLKSRTENTSPFLMFEHKKRSETPYLTKDNLKRMWYELDPKERQTLMNIIIKPMDPIISKYRPDLNVGAISEMLDKIMHDYVKSDLKHNPKNIVKEFKETLNICFMRSLCAPGEAVGLLAAQSIGEPSTQMTLNTFHFAGRGEMNVTLGVPRLRELLMTASSDISTPSMEIPFRTDIDPNVNLEEEGEKVRMRLNAVRLKDVLEYVDINEHFEISQDSLRERSHIYKIRFGFLPKSYYKRKYFTKPSKVLHFMETSFIRQFIEELNRKLRLLIQSNGIFDTKSTKNQSTIRSTKKKVIVDGDEEEMMQQEDENDGPDEVSDDNSKKQLIDEDDEDEDFDDYDVDEGEGDTVAMRQRSRLNQEQEYEEPDQEELEDQDDDIDDVDQQSQVDDTDQQHAEMLFNIIKGSKSQLINIKSELVDDFEISNNKEQKMKQKQKNLEAFADDRRKRVLNKAPGCIIDYSFDTNRELWCEIKLKFPLISAKLDLRTIVEEEAHRAFVHRVGRIDRALLVKDNEASQHGSKFCKLIKTKGVSIPQMVEFERYLDLRRIYTNDMHAIARTYGIEAARAALIREIKNVFAVYGISVDVRHLSLIADHMTFTGTIKGMNRGSMNGISPLQSMTFETTTNFLKNSLLLGMKDDLQSPSSRIVIGRPTVVGTGLFETRLKPKLVAGLTKPSLQLSTSIHHHRSSSFGQPSTSRSFHSRFSSTNGQKTFLSPSMLTTSLFDSVQKSNRKRSKPSNEQKSNQSKTSTLANEEFLTGVEDFVAETSTTIPTKMPKQSKRIKLEFE